MKRDIVAARRVLQPGNRRIIRRSGRNLKYAIAVFTSITVLGTFLILGSVAYEQRRASEARAWNDVDNLSGAFEEQIRRVMDSVRGAIALLKPRLIAEGANFDFVDWTKHVPEFATSTAQIAYVAPDGMLVATSLTRQPKPTDLSDREHIRVQLDGKHKGLFVGKPVIGRISGQPTIQVTDRVENAEGQLAGILVFSLSPEFLTTLHRVVNLGETGSMILVGADGVIRASFGAWQKSDLDYIGRSITGTKAVVDAQTAREGGYRGVNPLNGEPAFVHWNKLKTDALVVIVSVGESEVFAVSNRNAGMLAGLGAGVLFLSITTMLILNREISRRVHREIALFDESRKVVHANENLQRRHRQLLTTTAELNAERTRLQSINVELNAAKEQADQANQAKTSLLMNMSHEFRTPMHAILNYTNMCLKKLAASEPEKLHKYLTNIGISGQRLLELLNALLDLARLESGKLELRLARADLMQVLRQSQTELGSLLEAKQLDLRIDCQSRDAFGVFDKERMMQVFINLLSNAIKFSPKGGVVEIKVMDDVLPDRGPAYHCIVSDEGVGIPEAERETIFNKFEQSSKTSGAGGSGLGLAICREIVHLHQGVIWAAAAPSGGAAIHVLVPREPAGTGTNPILAAVC
jgi:two-component system, NarL family, sensor histidine kinase BarA